MRSNKGQMGLGSLQVVGIIFVTAAIVFGVGGLILNQISSQITADATNGNTFVCGINGTYAYNSTCDGSEGVGKLASWLPTIALVIAAAVVIGVVIGALGRQR